MPLPMPLTRRGASLALACGPSRTVFSPRMLTTEGLAFWAALTIGVIRWSDAVAAPQRVTRIPAQAKMAQRRPAMRSVFGADRSSMIVLSQWVGMP